VSHGLVLCCTVYCSTDEAHLCIRIMYLQGCKVLCCVRLLCGKFIMHSRKENSNCLEFLMKISLNRLLEALVYLTEHF
jgi:hypothetical protein